MSGPGFEVAPGDPAQLSQAAAVHQDLADALELHDAEVRGTAGALFSEWDGEAASAYQNLSEDVSLSYVLAAGIARSSASALATFSTTLEHCQQLGAKALHEAEYWLEQQVLWQGKLNAANAAAAQAQSSLSAGRSAGPFSIIGVIQADQARAALSQAESDQRVARAKLAQAKEQATIWEAAGRLAWDEAMQAAQRASGMIGSLDITPPPLAGWPVNTPLPVPPPKPKSSGGGGLWGDLEHGLEWAVLASNPVGQGMIAMHFASDWSGKTIAICAGGSGSIMPVGGTASVCYVATPNGGQGFTETLGGAGAVGDGVSGFVGPMISNGQTLSDQGSWFRYVSAGGGEGPWGVGGSVAQGTNGQGKAIWDFSGGWSPSLGDGFTAQGGDSYTWTQSLPPLP